MVELSEIEGVFAVVTSAMLEGKGENGWKIGGCFDVTFCLVVSRRDLKSNFYHVEN